MDLRFQEPEMKARIASLYLPLIGIVIDALPQLYDPNMDAKSRSGGGASLQTDESSTPGIDQTIAMAIAGSSVYSIPSESSSVWL